MKFSEITSNVESSIKHIDNVHKTLRNDHPEANLSSLLDLATNLKQLGIAVNNQLSRNRAYTKFKPGEGGGQIITHPILEMDAISTFCKADLGKGHLPDELNEVRPFSKKFISLRSKTSDLFDEAYKTVKKLA